MKNEKIEKPNAFQKSFSYKNKKNTASSVNSLTSNWKIRAQRVLIIPEKNSNKTAEIMEKEKAIKFAKSEGLDLIQISSDKKDGIPVCRIIDLGKFKYELSKKAKAEKKNKREALQEIKQVQFTVTTDDNDFKRMIEHAGKFLSENNKVKTVLRFRNRHEFKNIEIAKEMFFKFTNEIKNKFNAFPENSKIFITSKEISQIFCPFKK